MPKLVVTINQECCRCKTEIQKVLTCLQNEFCIEKIEIEKNSKVTITGKFDADKLKCRLQCKVGKFIKTIDKVDEKDEKKKDEKKDEKKDPPCKLVHVYPWPYPPCPNPYQVPCGAYPSSQGSCSSCYPQQCQCYYYGKPPSPLAKPPSPCACAKCRGPSCSSGDDHCGGHGYCCGSSCSSKPEKTSEPESKPKPATEPAPVLVPVPVPYTYPAPLIVCDDNNPSYACSVM